MNFEDIFELLALGTQVNIYDQYGNALYSNDDIVIPDRCFSKKVISLAIDEENGILIVTIEV